MGWGHGEISLIYASELLITVKVNVRSLLRSKTSETTSTVTPDGEATNFRVQRNLHSYAGTIRHERARGLGCFLCKAFFVGTAQSIICKAGHCFSRGYRVNRRRF